MDFILPASVVKPETAPAPVILIPPVLQNNTRPEWHDPGLPVSFNLPPLPPDPAPNKTKSPDIAQIVRHNVTEPVEPAQPVVEEEILEETTPSIPPAIENNGAPVYSAINFPRILPTHKPLAGLNRDQVCSPLRALNLHSAPLYLSMVGFPVTWTQDKPTGRVTVIEPLTLIDVNVLAYFLSKIGTTWNRLETVVDRIVEDTGVCKTYVKLALLKLQAAELIWVTGWHRVGITVVLREIPEAIITYMKNRSGSTGSGFKHKIHKYETKSDLRSPLDLKSDSLTLNDTSSQTDLRSPLDLKPDLRSPLDLKPEIKGHPLTSSTDNIIQLVREETGSPHRHPACSSHSDPAGTHLSGVTTIPKQHVWAALLSIYNTTVTSAARKFQHLTHFCDIMK